MNYENHIIRIPIYRLSYSKFCDEIDEKVDKVISKEIYQKLYPIEWKNEYEKAHSKYKRTIEIDWEFNEITGWIGIFKWSTQLRGEIYHKFPGRIYRNSTKRIKWVGKLFEVTTSENETSLQLFELLKEQLLHEIKNDMTLKNRYVDVKTFNKYGAWIDWKKIMQN